MSMEDEVMAEGDSRVDEDDDEEELANMAEGGDDGDSSDSSDSEDGDDDSGPLIESLQNEIAANKYNYEAHVKLIGTLRKSGALEKLRAAREAFNVYYPLTPAMWMEWAQDEARLVSGPRDVAAVEALYERGSWNTRNEELAVSSVENQTCKRRYMERALAAVGLHYADGGKIWKEFRNLELSWVNSVQGAESRAKQVENVRTIFHRQLTVPSSDLETTLADYKAWEKEQNVIVGDENDEVAGIPIHVSSAYKKALQMSNTRAPLEERISTLEAGSTQQLEQYLEYITIEEETGEPARAQVMYERVITAFPVNHDVWLRYSDYLEKNLKVASLLRSIYSRAVRNCPWVEVLWRNYMLTLERAHASDDEIAMVFEQSLSGGYQTAEEYLDLYLTRTDGIRRRIMTESDDNERQRLLDVLRSTFDKAAEFIASVFPDYVDRSLQLHAYWAHIEAHLAKDLAAARGVWESLIRTCGWMTEVWQGYIAMELSLQNIKEARSVYKNAYGRRLEGNGIEIMCYAWLRFEREHGTLEDYDRALTKIGPRLAEAQMQSHHQTAAPQISNQVDRVKDQAEKGSRNGNQDLAPGKRKRGDDSGFKEPKPVQKRPKAAEGDGSVNTAKQKEDLPFGDGSVKTAKQKEDLHDASEMEASEGKAFKSTESKDKQSLKETPKLYTDEFTVFLKNLSFNVTEDQLREFFASGSGVKEVRLLRDKKTGQPRGLAYVELEDEESVAAAVAKDGQELGGRTIRIARSAPTKGGRGAQGGRGSRGGRHGSGGRGEGRNEDGNVRGGGGGNRLGLGHRRGGKVNLSGSSTFAVPRAVARPLGWKAAQTPADEAPKSNDEFRKMLLEKKA